MFSIATYIALVLCIVFTRVQGASEISFLVLGDWGGLPVSPYRTPVEWAVAIKMGYIASHEDSQFTISLGDNFYFDGVTDIHDKRFQETFEDVFNAKSLQIPWYMLAGNHDHYGNVSAQVAYSSISKKWIFPSLWYSFEKTISSSGLKVEFIMLDTIVLCGNTKPMQRGAQPLGPEDSRLAEDQWTWLKEQLEKSSADYLFVAGHFPVWSVAEHGPTACLVDRLRPLLFTYNVTAYLSGHDHNLQHLNETHGTQTMDYFVIGSANFIDPAKDHEDDVPPNSLRFFWANIFKLGAFASLRVNEKNANLTFIDASGASLYTHPLKRRHV